MMTCTRALHFCAGHRVLGHEGKCAQPHGHQYKAEVTVRGALDAIGRVIDFSCIKDCIGAWIDANWDHAFIVGMEDHELLDALGRVDGSRVFTMPHNPTAENIADFLLSVCMHELPSNVRADHVRVWETPNCYADAYR
ncbi:MAG: 6-carboxytetrahydropterin synthase [Gemmatimonadales bacterium]